MDDLVYEGAPHHTPNSEITDPTPKTPTDDTNTTH